MKALVKLSLGAVVVVAALLFTAPKQAEAHRYWSYRPVPVRAYYPPRRVVYRPAYYPRVHAYYAPAYYAPAPAYYGGYGPGCYYGW